MQTMSLIAISVEDARQILRNVGYLRSRDFIVQGIQQKQFDFGVVIDTGKELRCDIYLTKLEKFIEETLHPDIVPEVPTEEVPS